MASEGKTAPKADPKPAPKTVQERQKAQRDEKLEAIKEQVESGSLVIRKMTQTERKRYPAQNRAPKRRGR